MKKYYFKDLYDLEMVLKLHHFLVKQNEYSMSVNSIIRGNHDIFALSKMLDILKKGVENYQFEGKFLSHIMDSYLDSKGKYLPSCPSDLFDSLRDEACYAHLCYKIKKGENFNSMIKWINDCRTLDRYDRYIFKLIENDDSEEIVHFYRTKTPRGVFGREPPKTRNDK